MTTSARGARVMAGVGSALVALVVLSLVTPPYLQGELTRVWAMAIVAISLDLLLGYAGLFSLGHAAFLGVGGYAAGMLAVRFGVRDLLLGCAAAVLVAALVGALYGVVALRVRGAYFLLITFALAQLAFVLTTTWDFLSPNGFGSVGISGIRAPTVGPSGWEVSGTGLYYLAGLALICCYLLLRRFLASPLGMSLQGIRENETRMEALGYRPVLAQYAAFVLAAAIAGLGGALLVYHDGIATPNLLGVDTSTLVVLMVLVGGAATLAGPVLGAAVIVLAQYFISGWLPQRWPLILGAIYVAAVLFARGGLLPAGLRAWPRKWSLAGLAERRPRARPPRTGPTASRSSFMTVDSTPADATSADPGVGTEIVLSVEHLAKNFHGVRAVDDVSFAAYAGERLAVIGTNGAGKSTLFNLIGGSLLPDTGEIRLGTRPITTLPVRERAAHGLARSFQINALFGGLTVAENLWLASAAREPWRGRFWHPMRRHPETAEWVERLLADWDLAEDRDRPVADLPYGHQRRLEIAMALATRPVLLLLDEPTAGLSAAESAEFDARLHALGREVTVLIIAHDPDLVFSVADRILVMHQGQIVAEGTGADVRANDVVQQLYMASWGAAR